MNPYHKYPKSSFWRNSVAEVLPSDLDPFVNVPFQIAKSDLVSTMGSCFAQHISKELIKNGFNYYSTELPPEHMSSEEAIAYGYNIFSARYGNIYTVRQAVQLFKRAFGTFTPQDEYWTSKSGRFIDPFRPQIHPEGYNDLKALFSDREIHFEAVKKIFLNSDVIVFTLGLTEAWQNDSDGSIFPLAPGVVSDKHDSSIYSGKNFSVTEVIQDLFEFKSILQSINGKCKIVLTVSPVPLIATHQNEHVLQSTVYSKSVLRVAAKELCDAYSEILYFPSFEIINAPNTKGKYFENDLRSVTKAGVSHVMRVFSNKLIQVDNTKINQNLPIDQNKESYIICDEEVIEASLKNAGF